MPDIQFKKLMALTALRFWLRDTEVVRGGGPSGATTGRADGASCASSKSLPCCKFLHKDAHRLSFYHASLQCFNLTERAPCAAHAYCGNKQPQCKKLTLG